MLEGTLKTNAWLMNDKGEKITQVKGIQVDKESKDALDRGEKAAVALPDVVIGRTVREGQVLYTLIEEDSFKYYKEHKQLLTETQKTALKEIAVVMREKNPVWGV